MTTILTAAEMRALEQKAISSGEVTGLELMERAGRGVVEAILAEWPDAAEAPQRALVLCGPGNNGGDGFVVARLLKERGWEVGVFLYGDPGRLPADAKLNHDRWAEAGSVRNMTDSADALCLGPHDRQPDLVIDAIFGIGLSRRLDPWLDDFLGRLKLSQETSTDDPPRCVAVDVPSGLDADSGRALSGGHNGTGVGGIGNSPISWAADLTVTFQTPKPGHLLADGPRLCGRLRVVDIGLGPRLGHISTWQQRSPPAHLLTKRTGHKYGYGHALILAGGCGRGGAARLAARAALRIGAGLVTLAVPPAALQENAARLDAIMLRSIKDAEALSALLADPRYNALAAGPGFGTGEREAALLAALLDASRAEPGDPRAPRAIVLDADALTLIARDDALRDRLHAACVLTPHDGEFARLFPAIAERWRAPATRGPAYSKLDAARDAARESGATVLLKGPDTVIAGPSGRAAIHAAAYDRAAPWLATAGSGDVLTGLIAGLLARGLPPFDAAAAAAWLHVEAARSFGPGLIAEDLPDEIPRVLRALGL